ncbi:MAG: Gfo/Idh/MocA family oxidoreductase, partial [Planctomycetales bacterium]
MSSPAGSGFGNSNSGSKGLGVPSRRQFLGAGAAGAAAVAMGSAITESAAMPTSSSASDEIRIGVIGCGGRGRGALDDTFAINENIKLVALADLYSKKCEATARSFSRRQNKDVSDIKIHGGLDGYKKVLDDPSVDLVLLATSPGFRPHHIAEAVAAGKHVFAEKPVCVDPTGYRICLQAHQEAEKNSTAIVTGTQYRRQTNYVAAVNRIREGGIGDIISVIARYC